MPAPVAIFLHSGEYDRVHQGTSIAASATAAGRPVEIFFFWWALQRLARGELGRPDFAHAPKFQQAAVERQFEESAYPTAQDLLMAARSSGQCRMFACSASALLLGLDVPTLEKRVDSLLAWPAILQRTAGVVDRFYL